MTNTAWPSDEDVRKALVVLHGHADVFPVHYEQARQALLAGTEGLRVQSQAATIAELRAEIERLKDVLAQIRDDHLGDQPAAYGFGEREWVERAYNRQRRIAFLALNPEKAPREDQKIPTEVLVVDKELAESTNAALTERLARAEAALREHHEWHMGLGEVCLARDEDGDCIKTDMTVAYSESELCEKTPAALTPTKEPDMPGTPRVPLTGQRLADYNRYIAAGYSHAQAEWLADCDATRQP